jgi:hypothetical protein
MVTMVRTFRRPDLHRQQGSAVLAVVLITFLFSAIVISAVVLAHVEVVVSGRYAHVVEARYAADAALQAAVAELRTIADWTSVIDGRARSSLVEGELAGSVTARLEAETASSPLPARRAVRWRPFLWKSMDALAARDPPSRVFVVVWVGNDEADVAGADSADTNATVLVRAEAVESGGARRIVEGVVSRQPQSGGGLYSEDSAAAEARRRRVAILNWREVR